jgi:putative endonuclease
MYYVYILASRKHGTLYIGVTNDLVRRIHQHKTNAVRGFTARHGVYLRVWFERYDDVLNAIAREKELKSGIANGRST